MDFQEYPKHVTVDGVLHVVTSAEQEAALRPPAKWAEAEPVDETPAKKRKGKA